MASQDNGVMSGGERLVILDAGAMGRLRKELIWTLGEERARSVLTRFGFAMGHSASAARRIFSEDDDAWIGSVHKVLASSLMCRLRPNRIAFDRAARTFDLTAEIFDSFEVANVSDSPVAGRSPASCWILTGYLSGYASAFLGAEVYFQEDRCAASGDGHCQVTGRTVTEWGPAKATELQRMFEEEDIGRELTVLYDELSRKNRALEASASALRREVQERRGAQEKIERSYAMLRAQQESTPDGILIVDLEGKVLSYNSRFLKLWEIPPDLAEKGDDNALLTHVLDQLKRPEDFLDLVRYLYSRPTESRDSDIIEFRDGRIFARATSPVLLDDGQPVARAWYFRDITTQRRLESEVRQSQKMEAIGTLAGGIAHDFNNLLTAIGGFLSLALQETTASAGDSVNAERCMQTAMKAVDRAAELTRALLNFSRGERGSPGPLDLRESVAETVGMLRRTIDPRITIETRSAPDLWLSRADSGQIDQVLTNLFINARDAMPEGGTLVIETSNEAVTTEDPRARANRAPGDYVLLAVSDSGVGIAPELLSRIFDPFFTTKELGKGTGLGLAMVYGIIQQHGGWIECDSRPGRGTTFRIYLPRETALPVPDAAPVVGEITCGNETLLLVEDEEILRGLGQTVLESFGYRVLLAADGIEALEIYREHAADIRLVILDLLMPRRSGRETFAELHALDPDLPIIISSGYSAEGQIDDLLALGAVATLAKPFKPSELARKVREVLDAVPARRA